MKYWNSSFPDYPYDDMPQVFVEANHLGLIKDCSWHNDMCPSFKSADEQRMCFVDYADWTKRETQDVNSPRFYVWSSPDGQFTPSETSALYEGNDAASALCALLKSTSSTE